MRHPFQELREQLQTHRLYRGLVGLPDLRVFMEHHVFAVWDFMSLAKRLQQSLTGVRVPWCPTASPLYTRLINEIILDEESDEDGQGGYASHFALYLNAMQLCGANTVPITTFYHHVAAGQDPDVALQNPDIPPGAAAFVTHTLAIARHAPIHAVASAFFWGREDIIPAMFTALIAEWQLQGAPVERFLYYLERHIAVDADRHGPMAHRLVDDLCAQDARKIQEATSVAQSVLQQRLAFWDTICRALPSQINPEASL